MHRHAGALGLSVRRTAMGRAGRGARLAGLELGKQFLASAMQAGARRGWQAAHDARRLIDREALDVVQMQRRSELFRQSFHGRPDGVLEQGFSCRVLTGVIDEQLIAVARIDMALPCLAVKVHAAVVGDAQQPGAQVRVVGKCRRAFEQLDEHVLRDVLCVCHRSRLAQGEPDDRTAMQLDRMSHKALRPEWDRSA